VGVPQTPELPKKKKKPQKQKQTNKKKIHSWVLQPSRINLLPQLPGTGLSGRNRNEHFLPCPLLPFNEEAILERWKHPS
jgi:hypothetical protein